MSLATFDKIFGRKEIFDLLKKRVLDLKDGYRQNIAFLGGRCLGKTVILQKFITDLEDRQIIPIYLDLENYDFEDFAFKFTGSLLFHYSRLQGLPLHQDLNLLMESTQPALPHTIRMMKKIRSLAAHNRLLEAFKEIVALPQLFTRESGLFCLIILEEFQGLDNLDLPEAYQELGKAIMTQKRSLYVVTSSCPAVAEKIISEKLSLLFGNFEVVPVEPFDTKTSRRFLQGLFSQIKISPQLTDFLVDFTGGHPLYMNLLSEELCSLAALHGQQEIFVPLLTQAIENVVFNNWGILSRHFDLTVESLGRGRGLRSFVLILMSLSNGKQDVKELVSATGIKQRQLAIRLKGLVDAGFVIRNGKNYYVKDRLFRYWIKYVLQRRRRTFGFDTAEQHQAFQAEIAEAVSAFQVCAQKDLSTRIMELLSCFEDDSFSIKDRNYKLPIFRTITPRKTQQEPGAIFEMIKATSEDGDWCFVLKPDRVDEKDINVIVKESRKYVSKPQRCILISLRDLDENTRVKALQERLWIWNEDEVNALLNFYNKPFILEAC